MPDTSDIILDWIHEDGYLLFEAGWIRSQDHRIHENLERFDLADSIAFPAMGTLIAKEGIFLATAVCESCGLISPPDSAAGYE